ncbi:uncharacterized protein LOC106674299 [Cimex lectularius]|uniref:MYND-type domain-containing protein n=1 Tax=Cimex lectularius TaxID=79782 RepID=A0A8I6TIV7_CIMLE|nr:uncharacterized protein LOC106674299 [Cimex lectularius]XP_024081747.1 uncharacterized protein LOC106674299 [Cimex lectularius]
MSIKKATEFKIWYRPQFCHSICHICQKSIQENKLICPSCQMVSYCCSEHLEEDLDDHEEICEALKEAGRLLSSEHPLKKAYLLGPEELRNFRLGLVGLCSRFLGRPLASWEIEVCLFPAVCASCHKFELDLQVCQSCFHTRWCTEQHRPKNHDLYCAELSLFREILQRKVHVVHPPSLEEEPSCMETMKTDDRVIFSLLTEVASSPLSILHVIPKKETSVVHVIGPEPHFEANNLAKWDIFLFELLPNTKHLRLMFVGPEIGPLPQRTISHDGRILSITFHQLLYHEFKGERPDLVCAFNPGLYRTAGFDGKDTWSASINEMFSFPGVPVLITAYTVKEIKLDFARVKQSVKGIKIVIEPSINHFSSRRPLMNFVSDETSPVVYKNAYFMVLKV